MTTETLADIEAEIKQIKQQIAEKKALKRIAYRKQFGDPSLPAYTANSQATYTHGATTKSDSIYVGARVTVKGYAGTAEVVSMRKSGLISKSGNVVYLVDVVFNTTGGNKERTSTHEFFAGRCTNITGSDDATTQSSSNDDIPTELKDIQAEIAKLRAELA